MLPGLTKSQIASLRRRRLTRASLQRLYKLDKTHPLFLGFPPAALAELQYCPQASLPLATAQKLGEKLRTELRWLKKNLHVVGSVRRGNKAVVKDLDILVVAPEGASDELAKAQIKAGGTLKILASYANGARRRSIIVAYGRKKYRVDLFLAHERELPYALYHHTGSRRYNIRLRNHAKSRGWKLNQYGLFERTPPDFRGKPPRVKGSHRIKTEADLARFLGVTPRPPSAREH